MWRGSSFLACRLLKGYRLALLLTFLPPLLLLQTGLAAEVETRDFRLGLTINSWISSDEIGSQAKLGLGKAYEFRLTEGFSLGINLEYRSIQSELYAYQIGYGLLMKHYLESRAWLRPYLEYGLLMSVTHDDGKDSGTAHNTRLAAGVNFDWRGRPLFFDLGYHYSRLSFFGTPRENLDYFQVAFGYRWSW